MKLTAATKDCVRVITGRARLDNRIDPGKAGESLAR